MDRNKEETSQRRPVWAESMPQHSGNWVFTQIMLEVLDRMGGWAEPDVARYGKTNAEDIKKLEAVEAAGLAGAFIIDLMRQNPLATYEEIAQGAIRQIRALQPPEESTTSQPEASAQSLPRWCCEPVESGRDLLEDLTFEAVDRVSRDKGDKARLIAELDRLGQMALDHDTEWSSYETQRTSIASRVGPLVREAFQRDPTRDFDDIVGEAVAAYNASPRNFTESEGKGDE